MRRGFDQECRPFLLAGEWYIVAQRSEQLEAGIYERVPADEARRLLWMVDCGALMGSSVLGARAATSAHGLGSRPVIDDIVWGSSAANGWGLYRYRYGHPLVGPGGLSLGVSTLCYIPEARPLQESRPLQEPLHGDGREQPIEVHPVPDLLPLRYETCRGEGIGGARYVVTDEAGELLASGTLDASGEAVVVLPPGCGEVYYRFTDDPGAFTVWAEFELAENPRYCEGRELERLLDDSSVLDGWADRLWGAAEDLLDVAKDGIEWVSGHSDWIIGVLKGDFNENPSLTQVIARGLITMIPVVDQIADIQDLCAAIYFLVIRGEVDELDHWVNLVLSLIGLVPTFGSAAKAVLKAAWFHKNATLDYLFAILNGMGVGNAFRAIKELNRDLVKKVAKIIDRGTKILGQVREILKRVADRVWGSTKAAVCRLLARVDGVLGSLTTKVGDAVAGLVATLRRLIGAARFERRRGIKGTLNTKRQTAIEVKRDEAGELTLGRKGGKRDRSPEDDAEESPRRSEGSEHGRRPRAEEDAGQVSSKETGEPASTDSPNAGTEHDGGQKVGEISAKEGVGGVGLGLRRPAKRHNLRSVKQGTVAKNKNTVVEPGVDVAGDVAAINQGLARRVGDTFEINGRTYGVHDGTLFPISGPGFHQLNRGAFQALGVLNKFGDMSQAHAILGRMKNVGPDEVAAAMKAWRAGQ